MTEAKLIDKTNIALEDLRYCLTKIESLTEDGRFDILSSIHELESEVRHKQTNWED